MRYHRIYWGNYLTEKGIVSIAILTGFGKATAGNYVGNFKGGDMVMYLAE